MPYLLARARARQHCPGRVSDAGPDIVAHQLRERDPFDEIPGPDRLPIRADRPVAALLADVADAVDRRAASGAR